MQVSPEHFKAADGLGKHRRKMAKWPDDVLCNRVYEEDAIKKSQAIKEDNKARWKGFPQGILPAWTWHSPKWKLTARREEKWLQRHNLRLWLPSSCFGIRKSSGPQHEPRQLNCCFKIITIGWLFFLQYTLVHLSCLRSRLQSPSLARTGSSQKPWQNNRIRQYWKQWNEIPSICSNFFCAAFDHHSTFLATLQAFSQLSYCYARGWGSMVASRKDYNCWKRGQSS